MRDPAKHIAIGAVAAEQAFSDVLSKLGMTPELARSRAMRLRQLAAKAKRAWDRACREAAKADYTPGTVSKMERTRKDMMALEAGAEALEALAKGVA